MSTMTRSRPRVKAKRSARLDPPPRPGLPALLHLTVGGETTRYFLWPMASDFGAAFRLEKFFTQQRGDGDECYHVLLDGERSACECKGFLRWGHCKHIEGLTALWNAGELKGGGA